MHCAIRRSLALVPLRFKFDASITLVAIHLFRLIGFSLQLLCTACCQWQNFASLQDGTVLISIDTVPHAMCCIGTQTEIATICARFFVDDICNAYKAHVSAALRIKYSEAKVLPKYKQTVAFLKTT